MSDSKRLDLLAQAYDDQVYAVRKAVEDFGKAFWDALPNYRDAAMEDLLGAIVPRVKAGQIQTAQITRAYIEAVATETGWVEHTPVVDIDDVTGQRGVDPMEVYKRPIITVRSELAAGKSLQQAASAGGLRLLQLIGGDMQLAKRAQARSSMTAAGMKAYRRKLTGRENCALCVVASTQRYWVKDLLPIHPGCDCNVEPLPDHLANQHVIDEATLEQVHAAVEQEIGIADRSAREPDYSQMIMTTEHGEYGPVIGWKETRAERRILMNKRKNDLAAGHLTD